MDEKLAAGNADCLLPGDQRGGAAEVPLSLRVAGLLRWARQEALWGIQRSGATRHTPTLVNQGERTLGTT